VKTTHAINFTIKFEGKEDIEHLLSMCAIAQNEKIDEELLEFVSQIEMNARDFKNRMKAK
jgi:hypothetical protein